MGFGKKKSKSGVGDGEIFVDSQDHSIEITAHWRVNFGSNRPDALKKISELIEQGWTLADVAICVREWSTGHEAHWITYYYYLTKP